MRTDLGDKSIEKDAARMRVLSATQATPGGTTDHGGLLGLGDDDHAQYVHISAARTITAQHSFSPPSTQAPFLLGANAQGQLVTGLNADLLDGVELSAIQAEIDSDISTHAAIANAHHAPVTIGAGGLSSHLGLSVQELTLTDINHSELSNIGTGDHHSQAHTITGSDHTVTGSQYDLVGLTATDTIGLLTPSADPGAVTAILKSTTSGGLTLQSLAVEGAVTITSGDLTVGANVLFVDESVGNIGVNRAPDAQFDLDVQGALRAGVLVGPHAIQLDEALMICHYDGPEPVETDFTGNPTGHMGRVATMTGGVIYRPGKFGKAVQMAEATTNIVTNPSLETDMTGYLAASGSNTRAVSTEQSLYGDQSVKCTYQDHAILLSYIHNGASTVAQTGSAYVYIPSDYDGTLVIRFTGFVGGAGNNVEVSLDMDITNEWQRVDTLVTPVGGDVNGYFQLRETGTPTAGKFVYVDAVQIEEVAYATPYCDGSLGNGHSWSGTAHASTSSRTLAWGQYDMPQIDTQSGTLLLWMKVDSHESVAGSEYVTFSDLPGSDYLYLSQYSDAGELRVRAGNTAFNSVSPHAPLGAWHHVVMVWEDGTAYLYIDGVLNTSQAASFTTPPTILYLNRNTASPSTKGALIDDLAILKTALDADTIRAIYESDAPVFAESSTWSWRSANNLVWADSEGLWMIDEDGAAVLGAVGVDGKSWGGQTLNKGDLLVGDSGGYMLWDASADTLEVQGELHLLDDSIFDGVVTIGTSGGIYQGTGTFASPTTGLKMWNDSGAGRLAGYNTGTLQVEIGTDGKLTAGAGNVILDAGGIQVAVSTSYADQRSIQFTNSGSLSASIRSFHDATDHGISLYVPSVASRDGNIFIEAYAPTTYEAYIELQAKSGSSVTTSLFLVADDDAVSQYAQFSDDLKVIKDVHVGLGIMLGSTTLDPPTGELCFNSTTYRLRRNGIHIEWYDGSSWVQLD